MYKKVDLKNICLAIFWLFITTGGVTNKRMNRNQLYLLKLISTAVSIHAHYNLMQNFNLLL